MSALHIWWNLGTQRHMYFISSLGMVWLNIIDVSFIETGAYYALNNRLRATSKLDFYKEMLETVIFTKRQMKTENENERLVGLQERRLITLSSLQNNNITVLFHVHYFKLRCFFQPYLDKKKEDKKYLTRRTSVFAFTTWRKTTMHITPTLRRCAPIWDRVLCWNAKSSGFF